MQYSLIAQICITATVANDYKAALNAVDRELGNEAAPLQAGTDEELGDSRAFVIYVERGGVCQSRDVSCRSASPLDVRRMPGAR